MIQKDNVFLTPNAQIKLKHPEVVSIPISLERSLQGEYFVGQSEVLWVGDGSNAWAGLINPCDSNSNLYANVFTISNFSDNYLTAQIWLNTNTPGEGVISNKVSPSNTALKLLPKNKVQIRYVQSTNEIPQGGVNIYERIVPPNTTLVGEEDGKFIEPPCGNYIVFLKSLSSNLDKVILAFGWWEHPNC
jgi:hypothetical protein